jgi:hypothetical protein
MSNRQYDVRTVSLNDLLKNFGAPRKIDYLSIDTEGSEYIILSSFDFSKYDISVITVEHNSGEQRDSIHRLLSRNGFVRIFEEISSCDDWYIHDSTPHLDPCEVARHRHS